MSKEKYTTVVLPTRPQVDTIVAIFILKHFGGERFPGIDDVKLEVWQKMPEDVSDADLDKEGIILIDIGGGKFDHHQITPPTTSSNLVAQYLEVKDSPALSKLLEFVERDDFFGKGTISTDPIDRAFGFPGLVSVLNKKYAKEPQCVLDIMFPILEAFYEEEERRFFEMPNELEKKTKEGKTHILSIKQRDKKLKVILIETDNPSIAGFLRSKLGGSFDVVVLRLSSGHTNILTRQIKRIDLRSLAVVIRLHEAEIRGIKLDDDSRKLSNSGTLSLVPQWYYDPATNSLFNGGSNPSTIEPTKIDLFELIKLLEVGLSEQIWRP